MIIQELTLHNFRIYSGTNTLTFNAGNQNISIVSGKNGYGKTTLLMGLVWCMYGGSMSDVDDLYKVEIEESGGYKKYLNKSLNRLAKSKGDTRFHVSITFSEIDIPELPCKSIQVIRSFDTATSYGDEPQILIDGQENELVEEIGKEIFIRDFLLPVHSAKFFFFDAEKIVSLAEASSLEQMKELSKAYSQVLGIEKYEELRENLENLRRDYARQSANAQENARFRELQVKIQNAEEEIENEQQRVRDLHDQEAELRLLSSQLQEQLIRQGNTISVSQLEDLRSQRSELEQNEELLRKKLDGLMELAPFAIAGNKLLQVAIQAEEEQEFKKAKFKNEDIEDKSKKVIDDLLEEHKKTTFPIDSRAHEFYVETFKTLIKKYFFDQSEIVISDNFEPIHDFSRVEVNELKALVGNLQSSFHETFNEISQQYALVQNELARLRRQLQDAEAKGEDPITAEKRERKEETDRKIRSIRKDLDLINQGIGQLEAEKSQFKKQETELSKKVDRSKKLKKKDELTQELIANLKDFILRFKEQKKISLQKRILESLQTFMHKDFIRKVQVNIYDDNIEVELVNKRGEIIPKDGLSKGEKQLYATALLKGMVEESNIEFPVFIDSPMQKLDVDHARTIVKEFYPKVARQVVVLPLLEKEMNHEEYQILLPKIARAYLIKNQSEDESSFVEIEPTALFESFKTMA